MDPIDELLRAYEAWRTLTEEEANAIAGGDWAAVESRQHLKEVLQSEILRSTAHAETHWKLFPASEPRGRAAIQSLLSELLRLEETNAVAIRHQQALGRAQQLEFGKVSRTLKSVQQHYGSARAAVWQAYS